jgi:hypothetical protein
MQRPSWQHSQSSSRSGALQVLQRLWLPAAMQQPVFAALHARSYGKPAASCWMNGCR